MVKKALYIQTAFVGDLLLAIPALRRIKERLDVDEVHLVCRKGLGQILKDIQLVDQFFEVDKSSSKKSIDWSFLDNDYEYVFCPHESLTSAMMMLRARSKNKVGYKNWKSYFSFSQGVNRPMQHPEALRQLSLLSRYDTETSELLRRVGREVLLMQEKDFPCWASMELQDLEKEKVSSLLSLEVHKVLQGDKKKVLLAPGSVWATKRWTLSGYRELMQECLSNDYQVFLIGAPDEVEIANKVKEGQVDVIDLCGKTSLTETLALMLDADLIVCNDSGAMHLAAVAGLPSIALFGPTTLDLGYRPWSDRSKVLQEKMSCRPCGLHGAKQCPIGTHDCMKKLTVDRVFSAVKQAIDSPSR